MANSNGKARRRRARSVNPWVLAIAGLVVVVVVGLAALGDFGAASPALERDVPTVASAPAIVDTSGAATVQRISPEDAKKMLDQGMAVLFDVRSPQAFESSHAEGAISLPEAELEARFASLPTDRTLIFYCT